MGIQTQEPTMLTVAEVAIRMGVHRETVYGWVKSGSLPSVRVGGTIRIAPSALEARSTSDGETD